MIITAGRYPSKLILIHCHFPTLLVHFVSVLGLACALGVAWPHLYHEVNLQQERNVAGAGLECWLWRRDSQCTDRNTIISSKPQAHTHVPSQLSHPGSH